METRSHAQIIPDELAAGFVVEGWFVQPLLHRMKQDGEVVQVEPKVMQVLCCLAARPGEPVTREHLFETVWPDVVVSDDVLTRSISELRKMLGDTPQEARVIETIPRVGYRLVAPVTVDAPGDAAPPSTPIAEVAFPTQTPPSARPRRWLWAIGGIALLLVIAAGAYAWWPTPTAPEPLTVRPLTSLPGREFAAAPDPTGTHVAFIGSQNGGTDLYVMRGGSTEPLRLTDTPAFEWSPAWSRDGQRLAFVRRSPEACTIRTMPALGGPEHAVGTCAPGSFPSVTWTPDGDLVTTERDPDTGTYRLYRRSPDTATRTALTYPEAPEADHLPRFSPDGQRLAFVRHRENGLEDLFVLPWGRDGVPRRLTSIAQNLSGFDWLNDDRLVLAAEANGQPQLRVMTTEGTMQEWLPVHSPAHRPVVAGGTLFFERWETDANLYRRSVPGTEESEPVAGSTRMEMHPDIAPEGQRLVFVSDRTGAYEVWTSDPTGTHAEQQTNHAATHLAWPRWSPDGQRIAYAAVVDGQADVYVLDQPGEPPRRLTTHPAADTAPAWGPDGQWMYFASERGGSWQVWRVPVGGGTAKQITQRGGTFPQLAADGTLYFSKRSERGIWKRQPDGSDVQVRNSPMASRDRLWVVHPTGLYYLDRDSTNGMVLHHYDEATQRIVATEPLGPAMTEGGFALGPDGDALFLVQIDRADADLMQVTVPR